MKREPKTCKRCAELERRCAELEQQLKMAPKILEQKLAPVVEGINKAMRLIDELINERDALAEQVEEFEQERAEREDQQWRQGIYNRWRERDRSNGATP
jgi:hypothetical protein